jgi:hypothetical protein
MSPVDHRSVKKSEPRLAVAFLLLALSAFLAGCDRTEGYTAVNATGIPLDMYYAPDDDRVVFSLEPLETKTIAEFERGWTGRLIARDRRTGVIVYDEQITWEQLLATEKVVIQ